MTDRYIGSWEAANHPRTIDYPFTLIQLQVDKTDTAREGVDLHEDHGDRERHVELENFTNEPVILRRGAHDEIDRLYQCPRS